ncbi:hypothetical protein [Streptomyces scabiei]|uniref:hypothetical protein n=1 Tax=Streptomyces scabiei TaxID=1930 RepID=UPI001B3250FE
MRHGRGFTLALGAAAFALVVASQGAAVALPDRPAAGEREFGSSFEPDDPAPDWLSTTDTAPDGSRARPASTAATPPASRGTSPTASPTYEPAARTRAAVR